MVKQILRNDDARQKLLKGARELAETVTITLGPKGRSVALDQKWNAPKVLHDGVSIAKEIELEDPSENIGAQLIKEAAEKSNDGAGDGTTTTILLAYEMLREGMRHLSYGANPMTIKKGMEIAGLAITVELKRLTKPIKSPQEIEQVATISSGDPAIGKLVAEALQKVGKDGVITIEESGSTTIEVDYREGMEFDKGYISNVFVTNHDKMEAEIENPYILITDKRVSSFQDFLPLFEKLPQDNKNLVIIAEGVEGEAFATLAYNKLHGLLNVLVVKAPGFADRRKEILEDMAILTDGTLISEDTGRTLSSATPEDLGKADKVWADSERTKIIGGKGNMAKIKTRIKQIKTEIKQSKSQYEKDIPLKERLAKLSGGVAVINVGAVTEVEMKDKKERVNDAVEATKSAIEEGIVAGGGITLLNIWKNTISEMTLPNKDEQAGIEIVGKALSAPFKKILQNAGLEEKMNDPQFIMRKSQNFGIDVETREIVDLFEKGIIDPVKVTRLAVQNAISVSSMILTTEALVTNIPEKNKSNSNNN